MADATAELELSEGISSNVVERFRKFEKEVSPCTGIGLMGSTTNWSKLSKSRRRIFKRSFRASSPFWYVVHGFSGKKLRSRTNSNPPLIGSSIQSLGDSLVPSIVCPISKILERADK